MMIRNGNATAARLGGEEEMASLKQILVQSEETIQNLVLAGTEYQDIEYCMANRGRVVYDDEHKSIDYLGAVHEMSDLDWTFHDNGISFTNNKNEHTVFFRRTKLDLWYVETPDKTGEYFSEYCWVSILDTESALHVLKLFFEESRWFEAVSWHRAPCLFEADD